MCTKTTNTMILTDRISLVFRSYIALTQRQVLQKYAMCSHTLQRACSFMSQLTHKFSVSVPHPSHGNEYIGDELWLCSIWKNIHAKRMATAKSDIALRSILKEIVAAPRQLPWANCVVMCSSAVNISWLLADSRIERCHEGAEGLLLPSCLTKVAAGDTSCPR